MQPQQTAPPLPALIGAIVLSFALLVFATPASGQLEAAQPNQPDDPIGFCHTMPDPITGYCPDPSRTPPCPIEADEVAVLRLPNYRGACVKRGIGYYPTPETIGILNDAIWSVKVGANVAVFLCADANYEGFCVSFMGHVPDLDKTQLPARAASSMIVLSRRCDFDRTKSFVAVYFAEGYAGPCLLNSNGTFPTPESMGLPGRAANDAIASVKVGDGVALILCSDSNFEGTCDGFTTDIPDLGTTRVGSGTASSMMVRPRACTPTADQVAVFFDEDYRGACMAWGVGSYPTPASIGLPNDNISSIKVGANVDVQLCRNNDYGGCTRFRSNTNIPQLMISPVGDNTVSSMRVQPHLLPPAAPTNLSAMATDTTHIQLSWDDNSDTEDGFVIGEDPWLGVVETTDENIASISISGLVPNSRHCYTVHAFNDSGNSIKSNVACATTSAQPPPPSMTHTSLVWLIAMQIPQGNVPYVARFPAIGSSRGHLTRIETLGTWPYIISFVASGYSTDDCGVPERVVRLTPGGSTTPDDLRKLFGSSTPSLPLQFIACVAPPGSRPTMVPINITYTDN